MSPRELTTDVVSPRGKFAKNVLIIGLTQVSVALSRLIVLPLLTKVLGTYDYGIWSQVNVTIGLVTVFSRVGLNVALCRFVSARTRREELQEDFYSVLSVALLTSMIASFPLIVFSHPIGNAIFNGAGGVVRLTGIIIIAVTLDAMCLAYFRALQHMGKYAVLSLARIYGELCVMTYLVFARHTIFTIILAILTVRVIFFFVSFFLVRGQIGIRRPRYSRIKKYLRFGVPLVPGNLATWVVASSDRYIIGHSLGVAQVGIYSAAYAIGNALSLVGSVLGFVLVPTLSKLYDEGQQSEVETYLQYSLKYFLGLGIPFVFGIGMLSKEILVMFSTTEIVSQGYPITSLVSLSALLAGTCGVIGQILILVQKTRILATVWALAALVNLALNILIIPRIGILGAAITTLISGSLALGLIAYYAFKEMKFYIEWVFISKSLAASAVMSVMIWRISPKGTVAVLMAVALGIAIYGTILYLLKGFDKKEIEFIRRRFQKKRK